jgi:stage V sporulation protein G
MNITDVRVSMVEDKTKKLRAFVSIVIDGCFFVQDIKIIEGEKGLFLSMPSKRRRDGTFKDVAHPINTETRKMMEEVIFAKYHEQQAAKGSASSKETEPAAEAEAAKPEEPPPPMA